MKATTRKETHDDVILIRLLERLVSWGVPLVTTNYDGLIEAVTNLGYVCWTAPPLRAKNLWKILLALSQSA